MIVAEETNRGEYDVLERSVAGKIVTEIGHFTSLRFAMITAEEFQKDEHVEFGIRFVPYTRRDILL